MHYIHSDDRITLPDGTVIEAKPPEVWVANWNVSKLVTFPHPRLKRGSQGAKLPTLQTLLAADFVRVQNGGVAIASTQVDNDDRWFTVALGDEVWAVANPVLTLLGPYYETTEGCLSLPGVSGKTRRSQKVRIQGQIAPIAAPVAPSALVWDTLDEEWVGHQAHIAQHECDHLDGKLYFERSTSAERSRIKGTYLKKRKNR